MMKKIQYLSRLLALLAGAFWLTACGSDEYTSFTTQGTPVEFRATIADDVQDAATRSTVDNSFEEGDEISLTIEDNNPAVYRYVGGRFVVLNPDEAFYWNIDAQPFLMHVAALYPTTNAAKFFNQEVVEHYVEPNQDTDNGYKKSDLLYAFYDRIFSTTILNFNHVMAKIVINIRQGGYTGNTDPSSVTLHGLNQAVDLKYSRGASIKMYPKEGKTNITTHKAATPAAGMVATFEALVIPGQTLASGTKFATIRVNDTYKEFIYNLNKDITLAQGTQYTFNLTLTSQQTVTVDEITQGDWGNGGSYDLSTQ